MRGWWQRRSLRARLTLIATAALAVGLAIASVLVVVGFSRSRLRAIDATSRAAATNLQHLAAAGALPQVLPVQAGQAGQVLSADGSVVASSPGTLRTLPLLPLPVVRSLARSGPTEAPVSSLDAGQQSRVTVLPVRAGGQQEYVVIAVSLAEERDTVHGLATLVIVVAPSLLIVIALLLWVLLGRALRAVSSLREGAESITDPASGQRLPLPVSEDEVHQLAVTLNAMLDRLSAASTRERSFIADAAHELRSPLASLQTQLEVAAGAGGDAERAELTQGALEDARRLVALVEDLLALARLDAGVPAAVDLVDLAALAGVPEQGPAVVRGDAATLGRVIGNLIANAERHARSRVEVGVAVSGSTVSLHVDDDGPGIAPADRERVFERFVRLDAARTRFDGGSGIGLAIVRAAVEAHGGTAVVSDSPLGGARFTVQLPAAPAAAEKSSIAADAGQWSHEAAPAP